jgi:hypothetical protein
MLSVVVLNVVAPNPPYLAFLAAFWLANSKEKEAKTSGEI